MSYTYRLSLYLIVLSLWAIPAQAQAATGGNFSLTDQDRQQFQLADHRGKVILLFFGYTFCPDICPTELSTIAKVLRKYDTSRVQGVFVTVDPLRDTPEKLREYVRYFSPDLIGLTGTQEEIDKVKSVYRVRSSINRKTSNDPYYSVDHTANLYVIDQQGVLVNIVPYGFPEQHVSSILEQLL